MTHHLVVTKPFLSFVRGDIINDVMQIGEILSTEHRKFVLRINRPIVLKG